jgi:hypothetical protein
MKTVGMHAKITLQRIVQVQGLPVQNVGWTELRQHKMNTVMNLQAPSKTKHSVNN